MRNKLVTIAEKTIDVKEMRIGELEKLVTELFPESNGDFRKIDITRLMEGEDETGFDMIYNKLPAIFPELTKDDVKNAYMSEIEALVEAFVNVNFFGLKKLIQPMLKMVQAGLPLKQ